MIARHQRHIVRWADRVQPLPRQRELLRQRDVYHELIVFPDDVHDSLLHSRWLYLLGRADMFLQKFLGDSGPKKTTVSGQQR